MRPKSNTSMVRSEDRETIVDVHRQTRVPAVTRRRGTVVHISDKQIAKITEHLHEVLRLTKQIADHWARLVELWDEAVRCDAAMTGERNADSIVSEDCAETHCLRQTTNAHTQAIEKQPKRK